MNNADVVETAMTAYWQDGPADVSLNAICQRAGVSKPSVYREFGNEDGLTFAALEHYTQTVLAKMAEILQRPDSVEKRISQIANLAAVDDLHENGCLFVKMRAVNTRLGEKTQTLLTQIEDATLDAFAELLAEGRGTGEWTNDIPVSLAAQYLYAQIGMALDQRARGKDPSDVLAMALSVFQFAEAKPHRSF